MKASHRIATASIYNRRKLRSRIAQKYVDRTEGHHLGAYCNPQKFRAIQRAMQFQTDATLQHLHQLEGRAFVEAVEAAIS